MFTIRFDEDVTVLLDHRNIPVSPGVQGCQPHYLKNETQET